MTEATHTLKKKNFFQENLMRIISIVSIFVLSFAVNSVKSGFLKIASISGILSYCAPLLIMAVGMTSILMFGSIDLSLGSLCSVCNVLFVRMISSYQERYTAMGVEEFPIFKIMFICVGACLAVGAMSGLLLGLIHVKLKVPSFIASLGFMSVWTSAAYLISDKAEPIAKKMYGCTNWYKITFFGKLLPLPFVIAVAIAVVVFILQKKTVFGRTIFSIGGNERAARIAGMNVDRTKIIIFAIGGICAALGGIFLACSIRSSDPNIGDSYTMMLVASCVLGGTALSGGKGSALGTVLGALAIAVIKKGLVHLGNFIDPYLQDVAFGLFVLVMIVLSIDRSKASRGIAVK